LLPILVSIGTAWYTGRINKWETPYFYAAPSYLTYAYTQSNKRDANDPPSSNTTVAVYNSATTPARNVRVVVMPITAEPDIKCDQVHNVQEGPWGAVVVNIEQIPANGRAKITVFEKTDTFPDSFEPQTGLKYQYAAKVDAVETEFGPIRCDYNRCAMFFIPKPDDSNEPYVKHPSNIKLEDIDKEPYPDARMLRVPRQNFRVFDGPVTPVQPPPQ
jgi:hypothetical protein